MGWAAVSNKMPGFYPANAWRSRSKHILQWRYRNEVSVQSNNKFSNFLISQTYLSAMISSQSVPLLAILASWVVIFDYDMSFSDQINFLLKSCNFHIWESVEFVMFFLFLQSQLLQIHLYLAYFTTVIHYTLVYHKQRSTKFNAFKTHWNVSIQTLQNVNINFQKTNCLCII